MGIIKYLFFSLLCLVCTRDAVAQTDSVRFYIQMDTTRKGIRMGQDVALRYVCTVQYDSAQPPRFDTSVEVIKTAAPHRVGKAVRNGELTDIYEVGFEYLIRFKREGKFNLPPAAVSIDGKRYQTPPASVWVKPAMPDIEGVECAISLRPKRPRQGERFVVTLTCNRQPDSKRPVVTLNGKAMESAGYGFSSINDTEEHRFMYAGQMAEGGNYILSAENLSFGGTPYPVPARWIEVGRGGPDHREDDNADSIWIWIIFAGTYILFTYLILWQRFRKESNEELAGFVLRHHRINLNTEWAYTHYGFPLTILMIPVIFTAISLYAYITGDVKMFFPFFWCGVLPLALAFASYCNQRSKLNFVPVGTTLSVSQIQQRVTEIASRNNWTIDHMGDDCIVAHTSRSFPSLSWGEQIFAVFDKGQVWINSVNDLNKRSTACSFGYTKKNTRLLREAIGGS